MLHIKHKGGETTDLQNDMMATWTGVPLSDHASAEIDILLSSRLVSGVKDYVMVRLK